MIEFVMFQDGCPCCCSQVPLLVQDIPKCKYSIAICDPKEQIQPTIELEVYQAPWKDLNELWAAFEKEPVNWHGRPDAWRHVTKTGRKVTMQTAGIVV